MVHDEALRAFALDEGVVSAEGADDLLAGRFRFLSVVRTLGEIGGWNSTRSPSHLWAMNLHYHRFLVDAAVGAARRPPEAEPILGAAMARLDGWERSCPPGAAGGWYAAWNSYAVSTRILNAWLARIVIEGERSDAAVEFRRRLDRAAATDAAFLADFLEFDLGGNHLLRNACALAAAGRWFGGPNGDAWLRVGTELLARELTAQILDDGFHDERSPMYQALILEDLFLATAGGGPLLDRIEPLARSMTAALRTTILPDGRIALLNDSAHGIAAPFRVLARLADSRGALPSSPAADAPRAGYFRFEEEDTVLLFDAGLLGPDHLPAHAHCDALSIEWSVGGRPFVTDTGVDRYEAGPERDFQRGTAAHATLQIDGVEQGEPFGSFRMGRRPRVSGARTAENSARGEHDGFGSAGIHRREVTWHGRRGLGWLDVVDGPREVDVSVRLGLVPDAVVDASSARAVLRRPDGVSVAWTVPASGRIEVEDGVLCERFGASRPRPVAVWRGGAGRGRELRFELAVVR